MAIWLGSDGGIRIERSATEPVYGYVSPDDVDPGVNRFGFSKPINYIFITGDRIEISRVDENGAPIQEPLDFVDPSAWSDDQLHPDITAYVNVDGVGGVRLYESWSASLRNYAPEALTLQEPSGTYRVAIRVVKGVERCLARTESWELNTNRDTADITSLGEGFQKNMATLVSGSGQIDCFFDVLPDTMAGDSGNEELSFYLHKLALRLEIGSEFTGVFIIKHGGAVPLLSYDERIRERELFYLCNCVITEVAIEVNTEDTIHSEISFVTTNEIQLLFDAPANYLLQEIAGNNKVLQESDFGVLLEAPE
jgi:hypothetical protein